LAIAKVYQGAVDKHPLFFLDLLLPYLYIYYAFVIFETEIFMNQTVRLAELFLQLSRKIGKTLAPIFRKMELSHSDLVVMFIMKKRKTSRATDLAAAVGVPASTLTGILDRLSNQGFLIREPDPADRRSLLLTATPALHSFLGDLMTPMKERLQAAFRATPPDRLNRLVEDLQYLLRELEKAEKNNESKIDTGSSE
jgi:DNA-binding MarR family transcriptional regulator